MNQNNIFPKIFLLLCSNNPFCHRIFKDLNINNGQNTFYSSLFYFYYYFGPYILKWSITLNY